MSWRGRGGASDTPDAPWDSLKMFFFLSMIFSAPTGEISPTSPARRQQ